jgi:hypothetical protein
MYEKPQYITPNGYQRKGDNPTKSNARKLLINQKVKQVKKGLLKQQLKTLSPEAIQLIATAIKGMLRK